MAGESIDGIVGRCTNLRHLRLIGEVASPLIDTPDDNGGAHVPVEPLSRLVTTLPLLETLELERIGTRAAWESVLPLLYSSHKALFPRLRSLSLHLCGIKSALLLAFLRSPVGLPALETINIGNLTTLRSPGATSTISQQDDHHHHSKLERQDEPEMDDAGVQELLSRCPNLRDVCLHEHDERRTLQLALGCGPALRSLKLCVDDSPAAPFSSSSPRPPPISDADLLSLARACPYLRSLRIVFRGTGGVTGAGVAACVRELGDSLTDLGLVGPQAPVTQRLVRELVGARVVRRVSVAGNGMEIADLLVGRGEVRQGQ
ncbi:hypothetical protein HK101_009001 [Irineochytrium annulatum]|nr:hypothetical protein HK101_009001 [Irineochytrium annulatum]